eukprot:Phypoly_transcript_05174.p1 GENE.Phypoly_transcript_05174~~Phypoly_transcript_05174.p1  ORF type:complete len:468 (+),score=90.56 Phypoly_transcript_05174:91-1494(+)
MEPVAEGAISGIVPDTQDPQVPIVPPPTAQVPTLPTQANTTVDSLNAARKKHEDRAKRFGVEYVEPKLEVVNVHAPKRYINPKRSGFVTGFNIDDEAEKQKRILRAKKFGVPVEESEASAPTEPSESSESKPEGDDQMDSGMDVDIREERKDVAINVQRRLDTIYLYGTDDMTTEDIFAYFKDYGAACVEWINDSSCNIIFLDVHTAMRALQGMSKPLDEFNLQITKDSLITTDPPKPTDPTTNPPEKENSSTSETTNTNETNDNNPAQPATTAVQATPEQIALYGWRKGKSVKGVPMLMRYATVEDVKSKDHRPSAHYKRMLAQLRSQKQNSRKGKKNRGGRDRNRDEGGRNRKRNRNRGNRNQDQDQTGKGKRKFDDGDIDMVDPAELEKRKQRRKKFFPEESAEASNEPTNYIISSSTVPALLQPSTSSVPISAEPAPQAPQEASIKFSKINYLKASVSVTGML